MLLMVKKKEVIKYEARHTPKDPADYDIRELNAWRDIFFKLGLIGQDPARYGGEGFGNVSEKIVKMSQRVNKRSFIITGSGTGGIEKLTDEHYSIVMEYYPEKNNIVSKGPVEVSSDSIIHGALYDANDDTIKFVFHVNSPDIWSSAEKLGIPITNEGVRYGTYEMVEEVRRLFRYKSLMDLRIFSMGGHEDSVVSFGRSSYETGNVLINYFVRSRTI